MTAHHPSHATSAAEFTGDTLDAASRLALVARSLNSRSTVDDIVDIVLQQGMALLHADGAVFAVEHDGHLEPVSVRGASLDVFANIGLLPLVAELPIALAAVTGTAIWLPDADVTAAEFPLLRHIAPDVQAWAALPVALEGAQVGVFGFCFLQPQPFDEIHRLYIRALTDMSARPLRVALDDTRPADETTATTNRDIAELINPGTTASQVACDLLANGHLGPDATGVSIGALLTPNELSLIATAGHLGDALSTRTPKLNLDHQSPMTRAVISGAPITMHNRTDIERLSPAFAAIAPNAEAAIAIPAIHDHHVLGTIGITYATPQTFDTAHVEELTTVAAEIAQHILAPINTTT